MTRSRTVHCGLSAVVVAWLPGGDNDNRDEPVHYGLQRARQWDIVCFSSAISWRMGHALVRGITCVAAYQDITVTGVVSLTYDTALWTVPGRTCSGGSRVIHQPHDNEFHNELHGAGH